MTNRQNNWMRGGMLAAGVACLSALPTLQAAENSARSIGSRFEASPFTTEDLKNYIDVLPETIQIKMAYDLGVPFESLESGQAWKDEPVRLATWNDSNFDSRGGPAKDTLAEFVQKVQRGELSADEIGKLVLSIDRNRYRLPGTVPASVAEHIRKFGDRITDSANGFLKDNHPLMYRRVEEAKRNRETYRNPIDKASRDSMRYAKQLAPVTVTETLPDGTTPGGELVRHSGLRPAQPGDATAAQAGSIPWDIFSGTWRPVSGRGADRLIVTTNSSGELDARSGGYEIAYFSGVNGSTVKHVNTWPGTRVVEETATRFNGGRLESRRTSAETHPSHLFELLNASHLFVMPTQLVERTSLELRDGRLYHETEATLYRRRFIYWGPFDTETRLNRTQFMYYPGYPKKTTVYERVAPETQTK